MNHKFKGSTCSRSIAVWAAASISLKLSYCTLEPLDVSWGCMIASSQASTLGFLLVGVIGCRGLNWDVWMHCGLRVSDEEGVGASERPRGKRLLLGPELDKEDALSNDEHGTDCNPGGSGSADWSPMSWEIR